MVGTLPENKTKSLVDLAHDLKLDFFLVSFTDVLGGTRAKLIPTAKIATVETEKQVCRGIAPSANSNYEA